MFPTVTLRSRLTIFLLVAFLISTWGLALYANRMLREDMQRQLGAQQFATVSLVAAGVNEELSGRLSALNTFAPDVTPYIFANPVAMQALMVQHPLLQILFNGGTFVTRADGTTIASLPLSAERLGVNYMDRDFIAATLKDGRSAIGQPVMGKKLLAPIFVMSVPLRDAQGKVIGALAGVTNLGIPNFLDKVVAARYGHTGGYILSAPQYRLIVTGTDKTRVMQPLPAPGVNQMLDRYIQGYEGYGVSVNSRGVEELTAAKGIPVASWLMAAVLPTEEAFAPIHDMQQRIFIAMILLTLASGGLIWWATSWTLKREFSPMLDAARALAAHSATDGFPQLLPITRQDEIGDLIVSFNHLLEVLRQREEALREQEGLYRAVADNGQVLIWMAGLDKGCHYFNQPWLVFTGRTLEQEFGNGWAEGVHPDDLQRCLDIYVTAFDKREAFRMTYRLRRHDGDYRWLLDDGAPRYDSSGLFVGYVGHCLDVTEHRQAEDALRESEALFRAVSESAHDAIVTADSSGRIIKWNPSAGHTFGYSASEAIGQSMTFLMPGRFRDQHVAGINRVSAGGEPHVMGNPVELVGLRKDGSEFPLELSLARWQIAESNFFTGVIRDITKRKKIELELDHQKEHLEELVQTRTIELMQALEVAKVADQTKDAFLANMSHELRTPLSAVIGIANLAQGISTEPRLRDYLDKIVKSGKHLNRIINELLDLSKIAAGRMELEAISFSLRTVIAHVESVMSHRAAERGLAIVMVIDDAVPDVLLGDPTRIAQIFLNLIGNALKFTQAGVIKVRVGLHGREDSRVCLDIEFEDTGIGMRPEDLKQLFKPFSQADATVSRRFGGTGLGLAISRHLAEMMDGDISVASIEGSGTTFKVRIWLGLGDAADLSATDTATAEPLPQRYRDARILVADDQPLNREIVEALLAAAGITPRLAKNGQEVLDILIESGPDAFDLVLMDIQMPVMDGLTATRALRGRAGFEKLPIIAMTAHTMAHEQELNAAAGMNDHIGKPFDNASFYRTLAKWIPSAKQQATEATAALPAKPEASLDAGNELGSLRGVDVAAALARFCGNEVSYRRWLADFVTTAGAIPGQMRSEIAAGQTDAAGKLAHAFKGRVGMLGMTGLHGMVSALELVLRDGNPAAEMLVTLERSIGEMCSDLARVLKPGTAGTPVKADTAPATQALESVVWHDAYSVGVAALDAQHMTLIGMINRLADCHAARSSGSSGAFHEVLSRMFDYTQVHLKAEEDYLQRIGYPQFEAHRSEHTAFIEKMGTFNMAAAEDIQDEAAVHRYLKDWWLSHILESDMQYRLFAESTL
jgi:PAS domain S-box-containing protein/hemerythrin-like metal-binding protein